MTVKQSSVRTSMVTNSAAYVAAYRKRRYAERKVEIVALLGGACARCGGRDNLEIDHIDPKQKKFEVMAKCWCTSWDKLKVEIAKCQLLCERCHLEKTSVAKGTHGTLSAWRYCKCDICRATYNAYMKKYRAERRKNAALAQR